MFDQSEKKNIWLEFSMINFYYTWKSCVLGFAICTAGIFSIFFPNFSATSGHEHKVNVKASVKPDSATECRSKSDTRLSSNYENKF